MSLSFPEKSFSTETTPKEAKPFLKWVGGKQQLLAQYEAYFPAEFNRYIEPFVGGGAVFFHLWNSNRLPQHVCLFDNNEELINAYRVRRLDRENVDLTDVERAARTIYLNKTCYNGLYRVNSKGQFNVPMGSYKNPRILYEAVLAAASVALQNVSLEVGDFRQLLTAAQKGDFIYFDPPYDPLSKTASFTSYTAGNFGDQDQRDLADVFTTLTEKGCLCMLSNSYTEFIRELYKSFKIEVVYAKRAVNSDANGRGNIKESLIINF